jgi:hypothetical protein
MGSRLALLACLTLAGCPDLPETVPEGALADEGAPDLADALALELPVCAGGVLAAFEPEAVLPPTADSEGWLAPEGDTLAAIAGSWDSLLEGQPMLAVGMVAVVGYELCRGEDDESDLILWRSSVPGTGRALFSWRFRDARAAIVEAPHAFADPSGPTQAVEVFVTTGARGLVSGGSHPCANAEEPLCGGGSPMCEARSAASDPVTNDASIFQLGHELFADTWPGDWVISLQAMDEDGLALSDGTLSGADDGAAAAIGAEVLAAMPQTVVTSCNGLLGASPGRRFCGTEGVQARHANDAADVCGPEAPAPSGRYLQIARSAEARAQAETLATAIDRGLALHGR